MNQIKKKIMKIVSEIGEKKFKGAIKTKMILLDAVVGVILYGAEILECERQKN